MTVLADCIRQALSMYFGPSTGNSLGEMRIARSGERGGRSLAACKRRCERPPQRAAGANLNVMAVEVQQLPQRLPGTSITHALSLSLPGRSTAWHLGVSVAAEHELHFFHLRLQQGAPPAAKKKHGHTPATKSHRYK